MPPFRSSIKPQAPRGLRTTVPDPNHHIDQILVHVKVSICAPGPSPNGLHPLELLADLGSLQPRRVLLESSFVDGAAVDPRQLPRERARDASEGLEEWLGRLLVELAHPLDLSADRAAARFGQPRLVRYVLRDVPRLRGPIEGSLGILHPARRAAICCHEGSTDEGDRKSTRLNYSHVKISIAVFCQHT